MLPKITKGNNLEKECPKNLFFDMEVSIKLFIVINYIKLKPGKSGFISLSTNFKNIAMYGNNDKIKELLKGVLLKFATGN